MSRTPYIIGTAIFVVMLIVVISLGFFDVWIFFGMAFYISLFIGGYFFIMIGWSKDREQERYESTRRQKFDWCFAKVNEALKKMPGGQGIEWDSGFGRVSDFKTFHDGTQNKPFRSILGYLSGTQQLVLIIYDIENDDIVKYDANPRPQQITDHFYNFNPFKSQHSSFGVSRAYRRDSRGRIISDRRKGMSIHINNDDDYGAENDRPSFEDLKTKPDKGVVDDVYKRLDK